MCAKMSNITKIAIDQFTYTKDILQENHVSHNHTLAGRSFLLSVPHSSSKATFSLHKAENIQCRQNITVFNQHVAYMIHNFYHKSIKSMIDKPIFVKKLDINGYAFS